MFPNFLVPSRNWRRRFVQEEEESRLPAKRFVREQHVKKRSGCRRSNVKRYKVHTMPVLRPFDPHVIQTYSPCMHTNRSLESGAFLQLQLQRRRLWTALPGSFQSVGAHAYAATSVYRTLFQFPYAATRRNEVVKSHMNSLRTLLVSSRPWSTQIATSKPQRQRRISQY
jgi:hypothetical protein